jgi:hypothetical protein
MCRAMKQRCLCYYTMADTYSQVPVARTRLQAPTPARSVEL